ncbi:MAG TPA: PIN domain-containing protein [Clostridia bacterium]
MVSKQKKLKQSPSKSIVAIIRLVLVPMGFVTGWIISKEIMSIQIDGKLLLNMQGWLKVCIQVVSGLFISFLAFLIAPVVMKGIFALSGLIENALSKYSAKEVVMGILGLVVGVLLGFVCWFLLNSVESINPAFTITITVILMLIFGVVGMRLGAKLMSQVLPATNLTERSTLSVNDCPNMILLDTSALIDGRVLDIVRTGFLSGEVLIPNFVLTELARIADDEDVLKKNRGRRGLDIAAALQKEKAIHVKITDDINETDIDVKYIKTAQFYKAKLITVDYNLNKLATANNIVALNINDLSNAIKPIALPGEKMMVRIVKEGKERGQGIGYLPDGTMIVIENGGNYIGSEKEVTITTALQTSAGRIIFSRIM